MSDPAATRNSIRFSPALAVLLLVGVVALGLRVYHAWQDRRIVGATAVLKGRTFSIEVADTDAKKELGLGKRDQLAPDRGMYFPFPAPARLIFWMKDMRFPIDIVWLREGRIVDISPSVPVPRGEHLDTYSPKEPADAVLELNAGVAAELRLAPGDVIRIEGSHR